MDPEVEQRPLPLQRVRPPAAIPLGRPRAHPHLCRRPHLRRRREEVASGAYRTKSYKNL
jgi:hypothetical protein